MVLSGHTARVVLLPRSFDSAAGAIVLRAHTNKVSEEDARLWKDREVE